MCLLLGCEDWEIEAPAEKQKVNLSYLVTLTIIYDVTFYILK